MKRLLPLIILLAACATEEKVGPSQPSTFVRYFNGGSEDDAQAVLETSDGGFLIMANTTYQLNEQSKIHYRIKLIKTDAYGNQEWQKFYPDFVTQPYETSKLSYRGNGIISVAGGYVIVGEDIQIGVPKDLHQLMVMTIDAQGENVLEKTIPNTVTVGGTPVTLDVSGAGVAINSKGNIMVVGTISEPPDDNNMILMELQKSTLAKVFVTTYGAGTTSLANRLFLDQADNAFWGGTVTKTSAKPAIHFIKIVTDPSNQGAIQFDIPVSSTAYTESGNDFCRFGSDFAVIGTTNNSATGDQDIVFKRISQDGTQLSSKTFPLTKDILGAEQDGTGNEIGNSLVTTRDGGLLLLGTVETQGTFGRGDKDYFLIKIDAFGETTWTKVYGSKFADTGVNVIQASDGGYIVLGTSELGKLSTIMLMKTDKNGNIE